MGHTLVTGGAGFIGSHLTESLLARGESVVVIDDLSTGSDRNLSAVATHPRLRIVHGDARDRTTLLPLLAGAETVYHLAAAVGVQLVAAQPLETIDRNVAPTQLILGELTRRHQRGEAVRLFLASTSEVYGKNGKASWDEEDDLVFGATTHPRWSYGASKAIDEFLGLGSHRATGLPVVIGRFFNTVGPRQTGAYGMVLPRFVDAALADSPLSVHDDGRQVRCFCHVGDVVSAVLALMERDVPTGQVYNIGSDQPVLILDLARRVIEAAGSASPIEFQTYTQAYGADFEDVRRRVPNLTKLQATIGFRPQFDLDGIIADVVAWRRQSLGM